MIKQDNEYSVSDKMPIGLGFGLAANERAMNNFAKMTDDEKKQVLEAARGAQSKHEMEGIISNLADL